MELGDWLEVLCDFDRRKVRSLVSLLIGYHGFYFP
jgi:hypothetical protein